MFVAAYSLVSLVACPELVVCVLCGVLCGVLCVWCVLHVACCMLHLACFVLRDVCCVQHVASCVASCKLYFVCSFRFVLP